MLEISDLGSRGIVLSVCENKGADQLRGYREADLRLCFRICKKKRFSHNEAHFKEEQTDVLYLLRFEGYFCPFFVYMKR